jgi:hypothetical protein
LDFQPQASDSPKTLLESSRVKDVGSQGLLDWPKARLASKKTLHSGTWKIRKEFMAEGFN